MFYIDRKSKKTRFLVTKASGETELQNSMYQYFKLMTKFCLFSPNSPKKLMCMSRRYTSETHQVTTTAIRSEQMCNYDLDDMDLRLVGFLFHIGFKVYME